MLGNFSYSNPTKLYFGEESLSFLNEELPKYGDKVLLVYGGGSIKQTGLYDEIMQILAKNGKQVFEDAGVMPNPTVEKLTEGCQIAKDNDVDFILAVGGALCVIMLKQYQLQLSVRKILGRSILFGKKRLIIRLFMGCVLTMVGTGSEMNGGSVITNTTTTQKIGRVFGEDVFPKFSILNPVLTYTVPKQQMVAGFFDIMSHILEQYFSNEDDNTSDYIMEGLLKSLIHSSKIALENPTDYEARSNIMWTATWALNISRKRKIN